MTRPIRYLPFRWDEVGIRDAGKQYSLQDGLDQAHQQPRVGEHLPDVDKDFLSPPPVP